MAIKVNSYRPEQALGDPEVKAPEFLDFRLYEGGNVVSRLYPQEFSWYSFLEAESITGHVVPSVN